jgi:hypothetical protein
LLRDGCSNRLVRFETDVADVLGGYLRNGPVLTKFAVKVAAGCGKRKYAAARLEMVEGFLLDRIYVDRTGPPIGHCPKFSVHHNA